MLNKSRIKLTGIILAGSPPFIFLTFSFFVSIWPYLFNHDYKNRFWTHPPFFKNYFPLHLTTCWGFAFVCYVYFLKKRKVGKEISPNLKFYFCASVAASLLYPFFNYYDWHFFLWMLFLTFGNLGRILQNVPKDQKVDFGEYPLIIGTENQTGFPTSSLHENVQIVGGTGTGKTHYVIKPFIDQTIHQGLGCFIYDVKSNMAKDVAYYARHAGRHYLQFNLADPKISHTYNPLYGNNPAAIANRVYTALYYDSNSGEPYYRLLAEAFLRNLIGILKKEIKTITFQDLLLATQETDTFKTISWFCAKYPKNTYAHYFREQWLNKTPKERRMELSGLVNKLQRFCSSEWSFLLNVRDPDIQMEKVISEGQILLFAPDSARYLEDAKALSILAMMDMSEQLAHRYRASNLKPFRVFLDEFYNLAYPRFIDFINKCREAKINLFLAHQSLGDLRGVSVEFLEQVMNTASNKMVLRVNDPDTAESFARQFGTVRDLNHKVESFDANGMLTGFSKAPVEMFRFHPNLIKELKAGQAIVKIVSGSGVFVFHIDLSFAAKAPENFNPNSNLNPFKSRSGEIESSLAELMKSENNVPATGFNKAIALGD